VTVGPPVLAGCSTSLAEAYDVALLDLDGVVYVGTDAVPHAVAALEAAAALGQRRAYVTNNALRPPEQVAEHLRRLGLPAQARDVVTSAQAAARLLAARLPARARVLVAGGEGLRTALRDRDLLPVASADDAPAAVTTGYDPEQTWARLGEAALVLQRDVPWVASNTDASVPSPRGRLPGAGALVALLATATGRDPDEVAGKPHPALHRESVERTGALRPLVVGDRLDTDIEGARAAGAPSLLVLTGVTGPRELLAAPPARRPTYLALDLSGLLDAHPRSAAEGAGGVRVTDAVATLEGGRVHVTGGSAMDRLRAACVLVWRLRDDGTRLDGLDGLDGVD